MDLGGGGLEIEFLANAKHVANALKFICHNCKKLFVEAMPSGQVAFKHVSDDQSCWMELHVSHSDVAVRGTSGGGLSRTVESKLVHKAMMPITTLKDGLQLTFAKDRLRITATAKGAATSVDIAYMTEEPNPLDTSPCCPQNCVASLQDRDIRIFEKFLKRKVSEGHTQHIVWKIGEDGRVEIGGESAFQDAAICGAARPTGNGTLTFHSELMLNLLRPTLSNTASLTLYDELPLRIKYTLGEKKKRSATAKKPGGLRQSASTSSSPKDPSDTCLLLFLSPGIVS